MLSRKKCLSLLKEYPFIDAVANAASLLLLTTIVIFVCSAVFLDSFLGSSSFVISSVLTVIWIIISLVCLQISKKGYENKSIFDSDDNLGENSSCSKLGRYSDNVGSGWRSTKEFKDGGELFYCANCGTFVHISRIEANIGRCPWCSNQGFTPERRTKKEYALEEKVEELETKMKGMT